MTPDDEQPNFDIFLDCLSASVVGSLAPGPKKGPRKRAVKGRKNEIKPVERPTSGLATGDGEQNDAAELGDFVQYLSEEIFPTLPSDLRTLSYAAVQNDPALGETYSIPLSTATTQHILQTLPIPAVDSLIAYGFIDDDEPLTLERFLTPILQTYISTTTTPPPSHTPHLSATRPAACEICGREHLPLTYHHLIPRQVHAKAIKRGWHKEWEVNKVAWLCRACHSFVHRVASNEELAREYYDVELLVAREDVQRFAQWVGGVRWKAR